ASRSGELGTPRERITGCRESFAPALSLGQPKPEKMSRSSHLRPARCPRSKGPGLSLGALFAGDFAWGLHFGTSLGDSLRDFTSGLRLGTHFGTSLRDFTSGLHGGTSLGGLFAAGLSLQDLAGGPRSRGRGLSTWRPGDRQTGY